jgi:hypothetical protein
MENENNGIEPVQTEVVETKPETIEVALPSNPEAESQEMYSKRFSALNRERKAIEQQKLEAKRLQSQVEAEKHEIAEAKKEIEAFRAEQEKRKAKELESKDPIEKLELQVKALQRQLEQEQQEKIKAKELLMQEDLQKTNQSAIESIKKKLESNPDYDALLVHGAEGRIFAVIEEQYNKTGEVLQIEEVANLMLKEIDEHYEKMAKTSLFKKKFSNVTQIAPKTEQKTLSSAMTAKVPTTEQKGYLTDQERMKRAIDALNKLG